MGCTHYFVVDRLEDLVGEGDSPIFFHELTNTRIFGLFHNCMWQSRHPEVDVYLLELGGPVSTNGSLRAYLDLHLRLCLCLCLSLNVQQKNWYSCSQERTCIDFLSTRTGRLFCHNGSPRSKNWIRVWLGWLVVFCLSSNF